MSRGSHSKGTYRTPAELARTIRIARGELAADLVVKGATLLDVYSGEWRSGDLAIADGRIVGILDSYRGSREIDGTGLLIVPGFIDGHVHIESSLMTPARFAAAVLPHGTTTVIWDPHEITNVWGTDGLDWAIAAAASTPLDIFIMAPSCVPSTSPAAGLETSGAVLSRADLAPYAQDPRVLGLAEVMNVPGVLGGDPDVLGKVFDFQGRPRDGHCPALSGKDLCAIGVAGIHSCHESTTLEEAREKLAKGIAVLIREGSCAKDAAALLPLVTPAASSSLGLCSDDRNPLDIAEEGHISHIVDLGLRRGIEPAAVFRAASLGAARLYGLGDRGALAPGMVADFILLRPTTGEGPAALVHGFSLVETYRRGQPVSAMNLGSIAETPLPRRGRANLNLPWPVPAPFAIAARGATGSVPVRVIGVQPGKLLTTAEVHRLPVVDDQVCAAPDRDLLKIAVLERHHGHGGGAVGFVRGFGITAGAIATSINHDCHQIITVGSDDDLLQRAVTRLKSLDGGIVVVARDGREATLPLPIAGLMTTATPRDVAQSLRQLKELARAIGCKLEEPFLQLSFLALPVIPALKITDRGLVDGTAFTRVPVLVDG